MIKLCRTCNLEKGAEDFRHNRRVCKRCESLKSYERNKLNPEKTRLNIKKWETNNKEKVKKFKKECYLRNYDKVFETHHKWEIANKDKVRQYTKRTNIKNIEKIKAYRKTDQRKATITNYKHKIRAIIKETDIDAKWLYNLKSNSDKCSLCNVELITGGNYPNTKHIDHIIPLNIGGTHTKDNVRIICRDCNLSRPKDGSDLINGKAV